MAFAALCCALSSSHAQSSAEANAFAHKLNSTEVWENAEAGKVQNLLVEFKAGQIERESAKERLAIAATAERRRQAAKVSRESIGAIDAESKAQDEAARSKLVERLREMKEAVFPNGKLGDTTVIRDFPHMSVLLVQVRGLDALRAMLSMSSVRHVSMDAPIKPAAN